MQRDRTNRWFIEMYPNFNVRGGYQNPSLFSSHNEFMKRNLGIGTETTAGTADYDIFKSGEQHNLQ